MTPRRRAAIACSISLLCVAACNDGASDGPDGGGGGNTGVTSTATGSSQGATSSSQATTSPSSSTGVGGGATCAVLPIMDGQLAECATGGASGPTESNTTECTADISVYWPAVVYELPVEAGACLHMKADNIGSPAGADLFGGIVGPSGKSLLFDEESACSVLNPDGYACPEGGTTIETSGTAYILVGSWEGSGCPDGSATPFQLTVSIDGVGVDLSNAPVCSGDLLQIIP